MRPYQFILNVADELAMLPSGKYLLLKDGVVEDLLCINKTEEDGYYNKNHLIITCCGSNEIYSFEKYMRSLDFNSKYALIDVLDIKI